MAKFLRESGVRRIVGLVALSVVWIWLVSGVGANASQEPVTVSLSSEQTELRPGQEFAIVLDLDITPGYHIYAREPGETGMPTAIVWTMPDGWEAPREKWPSSQESVESGFRCRIYSGKVSVVAVCTPPQSYKVGQKVTISAQVSWLACQTSCLPGEAQVGIKWPGAVPLKDGNAVNPGKLDKEVTATAVGTTSQDSGNTSNIYTSSTGLADDEAVWGDDSDLEAVDVAKNASPGASAGIAKAEPDSASPTFLVAVFSAFLGGIILNLMPCVFPVLSIKALALIQAGQDDRRQQRAQAVAYSIGVVISFLVIAGILLLLRGAGEQLGWGFQMQSPYFVVVMAWLFVALGFNLLGFYEIGLSLTQLGTVSDKSGSAFLSGMLATVVATPCTAPFMGTALGYALTLSWWRTLIIFTALGIGMALPVALLSLWPAWQRFLPRPGNWMVTLKQALAFPLLLAAVYFAWVVDVQAGPYAVAALLSGWVILGIAVWIYARWQKSVPAAVVAILSLALGWGALAYQAERTIDTGTVAEQRISSVVAPWSPEAVQANLRAGHPVLVDFGAAWCLTCNVNERVVLESEAVRRALEERGIVVLKADWTDRDDAITAELAKFGRSGVPLYVYYASSDAEPQILPELLTESAVLQALSR